MDFVDWCTRVVEAVYGAARETQFRREGIPGSTLFVQLFGEEISNVEVSLYDVSQLPAGTREEQQRKSFMQALQTMSYYPRLITCDVVERPSKWRPADPVQIPAERLHSYIHDWWVGTCARFLPNEHIEALRALNSLSVHVVDDIVWIAPVSGDLLLATLGWDDEDRLQVVAHELYQHGHILNDVADEEADWQLSATYYGLVWETRQHMTRYTPWIDGLVDRWETTSVDFKRELRLGTENEKAEVIKDLLGLVNTNANEPHLLVIGFDDSTHEYYRPPGADITQERLEDIVNRYIAPNLIFRYGVLNYRMGVVGVLEVVREPEKLPYTLSVSIGDADKLRELGQWFVRHGSKTEPPTPDESRAIIAEGSRARGEENRNEAIGLLNTAMSRDAPKGFWETFGLRE